MKKFILGNLAAAAIVLLGSSIGSADVWASESAEMIHKGVFVEDVEISEMTTEEAQAAVEARVNELKEKKLTFLIGSKEEEIAFGDLGLVWENQEVIEEAARLGKSGNIVQRYKAVKDLEQEQKVYDLEYTFDEVKVENLINDQFTQYNAEPEDAVLIRENGEFVIQEEVEGIVLDEKSSVQKVLEYLNDWNQEAGSVELVFTSASPEHTREEYELVKDVLGTYTTDFSGSAEGRYKNVTTGAEKVNGTLLYPGDEFSFYEVVTPFTEENGYGMGGAYENGQVVQSMGGGICQVSTTLYNTVLRSELEVTERHNHTMTVAYVPLAQDAAIAGTYMDLKFKNNTDAPVYIEGYTGDGQITFTMYGHETREEGRSIEFISEATGTTPRGTKIEASGDSLGTIIEKSSGFDGQTAQLWKLITYANGETEKVLVNNSNYYASPKTYSVGTSSSDASAVAAVKSAIASGDINKVHAAISSAKNGSSDNKDDKKTEEKPKETEPKETKAPETDPPKETEAPKETEPPQDVEPDPED